MLYEPQPSSWYCLHCSERRPTSDQPPPDSSDWVETGHLPVLDSVPEDSDRSDPDSAVRPGFDSDRCSYPCSDPVDHYCHCPDPSWAAGVDEYDR